MNNTNNSPLSHSSTYDTMGYFNKRMFQSYTERNVSIELRSEFIIFFNIFLILRKIFYSKSLNRYLDVIPSWGNRHGPTTSSESSKGLLVDISSFETFLHISLGLSEFCKIHGCYFLRFFDLFFVSSHLIAKIITLYHFS